MTRACTVVRSSLAHHLDRAASSIHGWQRLDRDLELQPLTLVLVALDVEEIEDVLLPVEQLSALETVGELVALVSRTVARGRRGRARQPCDHS